MWRSVSPCLQAPTSGGARTSPLAPLAPIRLGQSEPPGGSAKCIQLEPHHSARGKGLSKDSPTYQGLTLARFTAQPKPFGYVDRYVSSL